MIIQTASRIKEIQEYYFSRKLKEIAQLRSEGNHILNLGIGSPDLPPDPSVVNRLKEEASNPKQHAYQSYLGHPDLREAFAKWYDKYFKVALNPNSEILPLIGSKEGIMHLSMTFLEEGDEVLIPNPGYPTYISASKLAGATAILYTLSAENNWLPNLEELAKLNLEKVKIMWLNYPHMPTGAQADKSFFKQLVVFAKKYKILLVNDNPYAFILNKNQNSLLSTEGAKEVAIELNSLSKSHNMAGWRLGMMAADQQYIKEVLKFKTNMNSGMFLPVQLAAIEALNLPESWYEKQNLEYEKRQLKAFKLLDQLECSYDRNAVGMFVWAKVPDKYKDAYELSDELLYKAGVFLTPGGIFGSQGEKYIRISLCSSIELIEEAICKIASLVTTKN
ncbi:MAG: LL-diaminopimelate aminotransferase [Polaribacter sp.]|jgi:LL-diaminopimelate aminotransferase